jgi:hypothetical protein
MHQVHNHGLRGPDRRPHVISAVPGKVEGYLADCKITSSKAATECSPRVESYQQWLSPTNNDNAVESLANHKMRSQG